MSEAGWQHLAPGDCVWCRPGHVYDVKIDPDNPMGNYWVRFDLLTPDGELLPESAALPPEVIQPPNIQTVEWTVSRIAELVIPASLSAVWATVPDNVPIRGVVENMMRGLLMDLDAFSDKDYETNQAVSAHHRAAMHKAAMRLVEESDHDWRVRDLAREFGYSLPHFGRIFRQVMGQSPKQYAVQHRIHRAQMMLQDPGLTISEIAEATGYDTIYHFSGHFKKVTGVSPTEWRRLRGFADGSTR